MNVKLLFLFLLLIISIGILFYFMPLPVVIQKSDKKIEDEIEGKIEDKIENNNINLKTNKQLILYWANWCGICHKIKPNWNIEKKKLKKKYPDLDITEINCDDPSVDKCYLFKDNKKKNLDGVPTILLRKNTNDIEYQKIEKDNLKGDRSVDELIRFCEIYT